MDKVQIAWLIIGLVIGLATVLPYKRCKATHNGFVSMLTASLMGIFSVSFSWVAVVIGLCCFSYGLWQNQHKYIGVASNDSTNRT